MIDIRKLKELVRLMVENDLTELDLRDSEEQVTMRRPTALGGLSGAPLITTSPVHHASPPPTVTSPPPVTGQATASTAPSASVSANVEEEANLLKIESPMVGTFYATPNPDSPAFVSAGSNVNPDTVVCIIEAMKIFHEIKAECSGTIHKVLVKNGQPVEFGQPLFLVKP
jgi:acetyl-CoA carboxylase biotin carboxyl carrier protein